MRITSVTIYKPKADTKDPRLKGFALMLIDDCFAVHDIRILEGERGLYAAMPSRKKATGGYSDVAHPINQETRDMIEKEIINIKKTLQSGKKNRLRNKSFFIKKRIKLS